MPLYTGTVIPLGSSTGGAKPYTGSVIPLDSGATTGAMHDVREAIANIPGSAVQFGKGVWQAVRHPAETARGVVDIGAGALQSAFAPESWKTSGSSALYSPEAAKAWQSAKQFYEQRYGGIPNIRSTLIHDPVGVAADISGLLSPASRIADIADVTSLPRVASVARKAVAVGDVLNPAGAAIKGIGAVSELPKNIYSSVLGLTTGSGKAALDEAIKGAPEFVRAMRGNLSDEQVLGMARQGISNLKNERGIEYRRQLANLKGSQTRLNLDPIKSKMNAILSEYNVKKNPDGTLDFSRSTLQQGTRDIRAMYNDINGWGDHPGDNTPVMLDVLKRRIQDRYSESGQARAAVQTMASTIKKSIESSVPEYAKMSSDYSKSTETINAIEKALSTRDRTASDAAMRKVIQSIKEERSTRRSMLERLGQASGSDIKAAAAGRVMSPAWTSRLGPIAHFYGTSAVAAYLHNPMLAALLPLASPRLVGEFTVALGHLSREAMSAAERTRAAALYGAVATRTTAPQVDASFAPADDSAKQKPVSGQSDNGIRIAIGKLGHKYQPDKFNYRMSQDGGVEASPK